MQPTQLLEVGRIGKAHGLNGEVAVRLTTNQETRVAPDSTLYLASREKLTVRDSRNHKQNHLVAFHGINTREEAERISGEVLFAIPIDDQEIMWAHELIGRVIVDVNGEEHGQVVEIQSNPASDLLVLSNGTLIPAIFITVVEDESITVDPPKGIFPEEEL
ncbi:MAG: ribosome maturation factor RimM [Actinomycetota bacterium]|nr:ribosome maturation factor RimM [Actinomycetota bacterium]